MLEPIASLLTGCIIANDIGGSQLAKMNTDSRNLAPDQFGQFTRRQWPAALQKQHQLIDHRASQQSAHPGFPILDLVHRRRSIGKTPTLSSHASTTAMLPRFENSRNVEMTIFLCQTGGGVLWTKTRLPFSYEIASAR